MSDLDEKRNDIPLNLENTNWLDDLSGYIDSGVKIFNEGINILDTLGIVDNDVNNIRQQVDQKQNEISSWLGNKVSTQMFSGMLPFIIIGGLILILVIKK